MPGESIIANCLPVLFSLRSAFTHRSASVPNSTSTKALYTVNTQSPNNHANTTEIRILDLQTNTSILFSNDARDKEARWLGKGNQVIWLKAVDFGATEIWIADVDDTGQIYMDTTTVAAMGSRTGSVSQPLGSYRAGRISACASYLKVHRLRNQYDDIAIAIACPTTSSGAQYNVQTSGMATSDGVRTAIWYSTLRKKARTNSSTSNIKYIISPSRFVNALANCALDLCSHASLESGTVFDISTNGIVFLAKDTTTAFDLINLYYIPLRTFTESSRSHPQVVSIRGLAGRSSYPVFSPNGSSVAFLKKQHPTDLNDRNRVIVINNIRDFQSDTAMDEMPTSQSEKGWHLSPYSLAWSETGDELYVVAVEAGLRKLFKIPAALSSIKASPEPITNASKTPADVGHMRMVFSAPMPTT